MEDHAENEVDILLDEIGSGLALPDLVGNHLNYLIVRRTCADVLLEKFDFGPHEVVPATLINSKGRVHARDYVVINPLGSVACLDTVRSDMDGDDGDPAVALFGDFCLLEREIPAKRDVFRVQGLLVGYIFSERLVAFIDQQKFTNFVFEEVKLS